MAAMRTSSEQSVTGQQAAEMDQHSHALEYGTLLLYSTSPAPHERRILDLAAQRRRQPEMPLRVIVIQTPLEQPSPQTLASLWQHFGTQGIAIDMKDAGIATRADAYLAHVITQLQEADLIVITGGSPERAYHELSNTPALAALLSASQAGAIIAACSAGALLFGEGMLSNAQGRLNRHPLWNWLVNGLVAPHFGGYDIHLWQQAFPRSWVLGIPNDAMALVQGADGSVESLGPEPLMIIPHDQTVPMALLPGQRWEFER